MRKLRTDRDTLICGMESREKKSKTQMEKHTLNMVPGRELWSFFLRLREDRR